MPNNVKTANIPCTKSAQRPSISLSRSRVRTEPVDRSALVAKDLAIAIGDTSKERQGLRCCCQLVRFSVSLIMRKIRAPYFRTVLAPIPLIPSNVRSVVGRIAAICRSA